MAGCLVGDAPHLVRARARVRARAGARVRVKVRVRLDAVAVAVGGEVLVEDGAEVARLVSSE
mgnify:CR=1 FL=1